MEYENRGFIIVLFVLVIVLAIGNFFCGKGFPDGDEVYVLEGRLYTENKNRNGWAIELDAVTYTKSVNIPLLLQHRSEPEFVLGVVTSYGVEGDFVVFTAEMTRTPENTLIVDKILRGYLTNISGGLQVLESSLELVDGELIEVVSKGDLGEISVVVVPAEPEAYITSIQRKVDNG